MKDADKLALAEKVRSACDAVLEAKRDELTAHAQKAAKWSPVQAEILRSRMEIIDARERLASIDLKAVIAS